ncbi:MAG: ABC transporter permease [Eubacteriales bacterium]|nr:ABC transporter permease [Eubacteriales bacterium]
MEGIKKLTSKRLFMPLFCLAIMMVVAVIASPDFFKITVQNGVLYGRVIDVINRGSEVVILAVGMTIVVAASAGTDISVGALMAVVAAVTCAFVAGGQQSVNEYVNNPILGVLLGILVGILCGCFNGFLVAKMKIQPMVATLILFTAGRGIAQLLTNGQITYVRVESFKKLGSSLPGVPIPTSVFITIFVVVLTLFVLKKTALGMYVESVGINPTASRLVGLNSTLIIFGAYAFSGLCASIAGLINCSRIYSADANNIGLNLELDAILAVALGGNSLGGGKFSLIGSVIGAYTIQALTTTLYAVSVSADQIPVYKAIVVIIIVSLQSPELGKWIRSAKAKKAARAGKGGIA